jgi:hypothetical protein
LIVIVVLIKRMKLEQLRSSVTKGMVRTAPLQLLQAYT